jgi:tRNA dimethylallyltransferase
LGRAGAQEIAKAHAAGQVPILVGGTGLYIRTLLDGIAPVPAIDPDVREAVRAMPVAEAHAALTLEDPERAALLNPADTTRVARALEVVRSTGHSLAHWQAHKVGGIGNAVTLHPLVLLPDRDWLYERCDRRFALMMEGGAIAEVEALLARHCPRSAGDARHRVAEIADYLSGASPSTKRSCAARRPRAIMPSGNTHGCATSPRRLAPPCARKP